MMTDGMCFHPTSLHSHFHCHKATIGRHRAPCPYTGTCPYNLHNHNNHIKAIVSAATAWELSQDLGNLGINLRFREFPINLGNSGISGKFREILVIPNLQRLTSVVFIRYLTACHSAMFLQSLTYRDHFLNIARLTHLL